MRATVKEHQPKDSSITINTSEEINKEDTQAVVENNIEEAQEWIKPKQRVERDKITKAKMKESKEGWKNQ